MTAIAAPGSDAEAVAAARDFAASIANGVIERDRAGKVPAAELKAFDASGLLAITVPPEHGGPGLPATVLAEVIRSIAMVDPAIAQVPQGHFLMVDVLAVYGSAYQRRRLFGSVLSGGRLGNALAERGGQHAQDLKTRISRADGEVRLNGRKYYTIEAGIAAGALGDAREFVRTRARPFFEAVRGGWAEQASHDPHTISQFGRLAVRVRAAEALLASAAATLDEVTRRPQDAAEAARGSIAVAEAKAFASEVAAEVASDAWKYHHVGDFLLNDVFPPNHGQI